MVKSSRSIPGFKVIWEPPTNISVSKSGDMAYVLARNQITMNDSLGKPITQYNKAVSIWRKQADGSWKDAVDVWNADPSQNK
jgi:ketosteroid isomerase-like protein